MMCDRGYGYGCGEGYGDLDGRGWGCGKGFGNGVKPIRSRSYNYGRGDPNPNNQLSARGLSEDPSCTRLLSYHYPDINFYICQLQLLKGRSP